LHRPADLFQIDVNMMAAHNPAPSQIPHPLQTGRLRDMQARTEFGISLTTPNLIRHNAASLACCYSEATDQAH
jgi:hypothetical protein